MPIITGGRIIEGSRRHWANNVTAPAHANPIYSSPGVPAGGFLNGVAHPGTLVVNLATGILYMNTGTLAATVWTSQGQVGGS
jgi:hypothetical protein